MWVQVQVAVTNYEVVERSRALRSSGDPWPRGDAPVTCEQTISGTMWARSEDLPPVTPEQINPVSAYKRTVQVHVGDGMFPEQVYRLIGAWSPQAGQLIADKFEEVAAVPR